MDTWVVLLVVSIVLASIVGVIVIASFISTSRKSKKYERGIKMVPMMIHLPPPTDDIQQGGRDERDLSNEIISQAQTMYSILSSTFKKRKLKVKLYGQRHFSFEIVACDGLIKYYVV